MVTKEVDAEPRASNLALRLVCAEVWGGNRAIYAPVELPGIRGVLYSRPCGGGRGGDVHYLSVCGSGLLSRLCVADVVGHGETVAAVGDEMHRQLRRCMNQVDQRKVLAQLNQGLEALGLHAMTTAAAFTYYPPTRSLSVSYAGHPPGWYYRRSEDAWHRLLVDQPGGGERLVNMALAIDASARYTRRAVKVDVGDRMLVVTDGVLEAKSESGGQFGEHGVDAVLQAAGAESCGAVAGALLRALSAHGGGAAPEHDDVTFAVIEFVPGPSEPGWWLAIRNRIMRPRGNGDDPAFSATAAMRAKGT